MAIMISVCLLVTDYAFVQIEIVGRVTGLAIDTRLKVQMGSRGAARLTYEGYHLASLHVLTFLHQVLRVVSVIGFQSVGVLDANQVAVAGELA